MMKKKLFSGGIYAESMRRLKIFAIIAAVLVVLIEAVPILMTANDMHNVYGKISDTANVEVQKSVVDIAQAAFMLPFAAIAAPFILVMILFAQFNKRPYSDFAHSLPYTRTCIFLTKTAAAYTVTIALFALSIFTGIISCSLFPDYFVINTTGIVQYILYYLSISAFITAALQIAVSITGTVLSNITVSGLVLFFPRYLLYIMVTAITSSLPYMVETGNLSVISPSFNTFVGYVFSFFFGYDSQSYMNWAPIVYTLVLSVVYSIIAAVLFNKRRGETAESPAPGRKVQSVIRSLVALVFAIPVTAILFISSSDIEASIMLYIFAVIAYFAYELITTRRFANLYRALPALVVVILINVCFGFGVEGISKGAAAYAPTANEIDSVVVSSDTIRGDSNYIPNCSNAELSDMKTKAIVAEALKNNIQAVKDRKYENFYSDRYVAYKIDIKEGIFVRSRYIYFTESQSEKLVSAIGENEDFRKEYMTLPDLISGTLTVGNGIVVPTESEKKVLDLLQKEINAMGFEAWFDICENGYYDGTLEKDNMSITYNPKNYTSETEVYFQLPSQYFPETVDYVIQELSYDKGSTEKIADFFEKADAIEGEEWYSVEDHTVILEIVDGDEAYQYYFSVYDFDDFPKVDTDYHMDKDIEDLIKNAAKCTSEKPSADRYLYVDMSLGIVEGEYDSWKYYGDTYYLPLPDDFDVSQYEVLDTYRGYEEPEAYEDTYVNEIVYD